MIENKKNKNQKIDRKNEANYLQSYCAYLNAQENDFDEYEDRFLIDMIKPGNLKLSEGQGVPDGIILDKKTFLKEFIELTFIGRTLDDLKFLGDLQKNPQKYEGRRFIFPPKSPFLSIQQTFLNGLSKKSSKLYLSAAKILGAQEKGTLLIILRNSDPFHDEDELTDLLSFITDKFLLESTGLFNSSFKRLVFGSMPLPENKLVFSEIWREN